VSDEYELRQCEIPPSWATADRLASHQSIALYDDESLHIAGLVKIDRALKRLALSTDPVVIRSSGKIMVAPLAFDLAQGLKMAGDIWTGPECRIQYAPFIRVLDEHIASHGRFYTDPTEVEIERTNQWFRVLRNAIRRSSVREEQRRRKDAVLKNWRGAVNYVNGLFMRHSKLLVVRIDLGYLEKFRDESTLDRAFVDRQTWFDQITARFSKQLVGSCWRVEYGGKKNAHLHVVLFFNGQVCREDITLGNIAGESWKEVTRYEGTFFNCNLSKDRYRAAKQLGIGMIAHFDADLRSNLFTFALSYLFKIDGLIKLHPSASKGRRTFGRGIIRSIDEDLDQPSLGRPRKRA